MWLSFNLQICRIVDAITYTRYDTLQDYCYFEYLRNQLKISNYSNSDRIYTGVNNICKTFILLKLSCHIITFSNIKQCIFNKNCSATF